LGNALYNDYKERGVMTIHVLEQEAGSHGGNPTWQDAYKWATDWDEDGTNNPEGPLEFPVIADTDGSIWSMYTQCPWYYQDQIFDQGLVTVDDPCVFPCGSCSNSDSYIRTVLDGIVPAKWCGEATP
jgi:hypothetical protein